jgi:ribonuclease HI
MSKFYVVWEGRTQGVFSNWKDTLESVSGFKGAKYKSYKNIIDANEALALDPPIFNETKKVIKKEKVITNPLTNSKIKIYCDGACFPNPGQSASGVAVYENEILKKLMHGNYNSNGTNNTAELLALHESLIIANSYIKKGECSLQVLCDSMYSINCITKWANSWANNNWKKKGKEEIKNLEIIKKTYFLYQDIKNIVTISHIKAHVGFEGNELADRMSMIGIKEKSTLMEEYCGVYNIENILKLVK